jgi:hypothetical protein
MGARAYNTSVTAPTLQQELVSPSSDPAGVARPMGILAASPFQLSREFAHPASIRAPHNSSVCEMSCRVRVESSLAVSVFRSKLGTEPRKCYLRRKLEISIEARRTRVQEPAERLCPAGCGSRRYRPKPIVTAAGSRGHRLPAMCRNRRPQTRAFWERTRPKRGDGVSTQI